MSTSVVAAGDGAKSFLAGSVPDLQLHAKSIHFKCFNAEIETNGDHVLVSEGVLGKAQQQAGLAHFTVANEEQLEDVVTGFGSQTHKWTQNAEMSNKEGNLLIKDHVNKTVGKHS